MIEGTFIARLTAGISLLRRACVTEVVGGNVERFFVVAGSGGAFGSLAPLTMHDLEAAAEAKTIEETLRGDVPQLLVDAVNTQIAGAIIAAVDSCEAIAELAVDSGRAAHEGALNALGQRDVPIWEEDNMWALITPGLRAHLLATTEFGKGHYVDVPRAPLRGPRVWRWAGCNWIISTQMAGMGTTAERSYVFHRNAIGHALDLERLATPGAVTWGIDSKTGLGWMKAKTKQRAQVLQPVGIQRLLFDGTKYQEGERETKQGTGA